MTSNSKFLQIFGCVLLLSFGASFLLVYVLRPTFPARRNDSASGSALIRLAEPEQRLLRSPVQSHLLGYAVAEVASYRLQARVLSVTKYADAHSKLIPVDAALGWGKMADLKILQSFDITQSNRWYFWHADTLPIPSTEVIRSSANTHLIPATPEISAQLLKLRKNQLLEAEGTLVNVSQAGYSLQSSLSRADSGAGACEVFLVKEIRLLEEVTNTPDGQEQT